MIETILVPAVFGLSLGGFVACAYEVVGYLRGNGRARKDS